MPLITHLPSKMPQGFWIRREPLQRLRRSIIEAKGYREFLFFSVSVFLMPSEKQFLGTWSVNKKLFIGTTGVLKSEKGTWKCGKKAGRVEQKKLDEL